MTPRATFLEHRGTRICLLDFSGITDTDAGLAAIAEARATIRAEPAASVLTLTHVTGATFNRAIVAALKELAGGNKPYVRAGAVVGLTGLQRAVYIAVMQFTGRRLPTFPDLESAKDWLVRQ